MKGCFSMFSWECSFSSKIEIFAHLLNERRFTRHITNSFVEMTSFPIKHNMLIIYFGMLRMPTLLKSFQTAIKLDIPFWIKITIEQCTILGNFPGQLSLTFCLSDAWSQQHKAPWHALETECILFQQEASVCMFSATLLDMAIFPAYFANNVFWLWLLWGLI